MFARHVLWHTGIAVGAVLVLPLFGVAVPTALLVGLMLGCAAMAFGVGHAGERHQPADQADSKRARADASEE